jgi:hypothetical protein
MPGSLFTVKKAYFLRAIEQKRCMHAFMHVFCSPIISLGIRRIAADIDAAMPALKKC